MINYSNMTLLEAYNAIVDRLGGMRNAENTDWGTIVKCINKGVKEVVVKTLPFKSWAYINTVVISDNTALPREYLDYSRVLVNNVSGMLREARRVDPKEYWGLTDPDRKHAWNMSLDERPIFCLWGDGNQSQLRIFISPARAGYMECYLMPGDLVNEADEIPVPYEYVELVLLAATSRLMARLADQNYLLSLHQQIQGEVKKLGELYKAKKYAEKRELDNFAEPVIPSVPAPPEPGELSKQMVK
jgi:hypothetical protein